MPGLPSAEAALARQQALGDQIETCTAAPLLMVWRCQPALLVSRTETRLPHFAEARDRLLSTGWPVFMRKSGGSACPLAPGTVQISMIEVAAADATMNGKYAFVAEFIRALLRGYGIESHIESVAAAYCPGRFDIAVAQKKIAGISQRWFRNARGIRCVTTAASINVEEAPELLADLVTRFYGAAGSSHRCLAGALTNMRLCGAANPFADEDLAAAVAKRLGSDMDYAA
jgi:octanoyl-[GcvH]:protein N-octanoyltransferase